MNILVLIKELALCFFSGVGTMLLSQKKNNSGVTISKNTATKIVNTKIVGKVDIDKNKELSIERSEINGTDKLD